MQLHVIRLFTALLFIIIMAMMLYAGDDGRALFVSKCGQCHKSGGTAPAFSPTLYASTQWDRFFARDKHAKKKDLSSIIKQGELESIKKYLVDHAADSSQPEAAGLK